MILRDVVRHHADHFDFTHGLFRYGIVRNTYTRDYSLYRLNTKHNYVSLRGCAQDKLLQIWYECLAFEKNEDLT